MAVPRLLNKNNSGKPAVDLGLSPLCVADVSHRSYSAVKRIMQEARELANDPSTEYSAAPLEVRSIILPPIYHAHTHSVPSRALL